MSEQEKRSNGKAVREQPKKKWTKSKNDEPNIIIIRSEELKKHIQASARSGGGCHGGVMR